MRSLLPFLKTVRAPGYKLFPLFVFLHFASLASAADPAADKLQKQWSDTETQLSKIEISALMLRSTVPYLKTLSPEEVEKRFQLLADDPTEARFREFCSSILVDKYEETKPYAEVSYATVAGNVRTSLVMDIDGTSVERVNINDDVSGVGLTKRGTRKQIEIMPKERRRNLLDLGDLMIPPPKSMSNARVRLEGGNVMLNVSSNRVERDITAIESTGFITHSRVQYVNGEVFRTEWQAVGQWLTGEVIPQVFVSVEEKGGVVKRVTASLITSATVPMESAIVADMEVEAGSIVADWTDVSFGNRPSTFLAKEPEPSARQFITRVRAAEKLRDGPKPPAVGQPK